MGGPEVCSGLVSGSYACAGRALQTSGFSDCLQEWEVAWLDDGSTTRYESGCVVGCFDDLPPFAGDDVRWGYCKDPRTWRPLRKSTVPVPRSRPGAGYCRVNLAVLATTVQITARYPARKRGYDETLGLWSYATVIHVRVGSVRLRRTPLCRSGDISPRGAMGRVAERVAWRYVGDELEDWAVE